MSYYPGTPIQQRLLQAIASYYSNDQRVLAVCLFGSLARGNWDQYSDLDLDVVIRDDAEIVVMNEIERLIASFASMGEEAALIIPDGMDCADVVLRSLAQFSIRYHPLSSTNPNIVHELQILTGHLDLETIQSAGQANQTDAERPLGQLMDTILRYVLEADNACHRRRMWMAVELLHRLRALLMELYTRTHNGGRPLQGFEASAGTALQAQLGNTLPRFDLISIRKSLQSIIDLLCEDLSFWSDAQLQLTQIQSELLDQIKLRRDRI